MLRPLARIWIRRAFLVAGALGWRASAAAAPPLPPEVAFARFDGPVRALVEHDGRLVVGGAFRSADGVPVGSLVVWSASGWTALGAPFDGAVCALTVLDGQLVAGGEFENAGAAAVRHVARWDGRQWRDLGGGTDGPVRALAVYSERVLYAGGDFAHAGGVEAHSVARWFGSGWSAVGGGMDGEVRALVLYGDALVAGGAFTARDTRGTVRHLARFDGDRWRTLAFTIDAPVHAIAVHGVSLVVGGAFEQVDVVAPAYSIARLTGDLWRSVGIGFDGDVRALGVVGGALVAGGAFTHADLRPASHIARFDGINWSEMDGGTDAPVEVLGVYDTTLVAGGGFARAGRADVGGIATWCDEHWQGLRVVPVAIQDFGLEPAAGASVRVVWALGPHAVASFASVAVERSASAAGPWQAIATLAPAITMQWVDTAPDPAWAWYRVAAMDRDGARTAASHALEWRGTATATAMTLVRGTPVGIDVTLAVAGPMRLAVFDVRGRRLRVLAAGPHAAGTRRFAWDGTDTHGRGVARGVYVVRLEASDAVVARTLVHMRR